MPFLEDIKLNALNDEAKMDALVKQLNEWGRRISNEKKTLIIKGDESTNALIIGDLGDGRHGILLNDGTNDRLIIGSDEGGF